MNTVKFEVRNVQVVDIPQEEIINYVRKNFWPANIFNESELASWAESNGYSKS